MTLGVLTLFLAANSAWGFERCRKFKKPGSNVTAVRAFARLAMTLAGCAPCNCCDGDAVACSDNSFATTQDSHTVVFSTHVTHTATEEIQDVTVIRYCDDGCVTQRTYQVQRTLSADGQSSSRVERTSGVMGRVVRYMNTDTANNCASELEDFVPCDD